MKSRYKLLRFWIILSISLVASFLVFWWMLEWHRDTFYYRTVIKIENNSREDIITVIFPIALSKDGTFKNKSIEQLNINKGNSESILYYLGKGTDMKNIAIGIAVWQLTNEPKEEIFKRKPYLAQTFYNSNFEIGPDKYGIYAHLIVE